uniref:Helicase ATP-binding domain-containing protein n=1 Tax=Phytophthora ramorum TaxID=164328 RepID=H3HDJ6_PHYRM
MTVTASANVAWGVACKRCDALVARHSQLSFLMENSTAIHLTLDKTLLHDEQREAQPQAETGESWRVYSHAYVKPEIALVKIRTTNAYKRERLPFELCCVKCDAKVASEGFLDELDEPMLLLDSKACACVLDNQTPYGMAGGTKARKWGVILRQLQELKLPFRIQKLQELIAAGGCGKTLVAIKVMEEMRHLNPDKLVVFIVPTGPLVSQQAGYIRRESNFEVSGLSGQHSRTAAATSDPIEIGGETDAIVVTPQYFLNLMFNGRTKITDYSTVVFDEAHHATGSHPYCELLKNIATVDLQARPHILALTASPFGESIALNKLAKAFNASVNSPTIAADDLESSFIPKEAEWVTVEESEPEQKLREEAEKKAMGNSNGVEMTGIEKSKRPLSDLELILEHLQKVASSFYSLSIHGAALINFPLETFSGADISNRVRLVAECIQDTNFDHDSRAIVFVRRRKTAILLAKAMEALDVLRMERNQRLVENEKRLVAMANTAASKLESKVAVESWRDDVATARGF